MVNRVLYADVVSYVFGDSQRWQDNWDLKSASRGTYRMLWYFIKTGVLGFIDGVVPLFIHALVQFWKMVVKWTTTSILREKVLAVTSWCVYYFYLVLASLLERLDRKQARKLQRLNANGAATIYFPRLDATLLGEVADVSLTGIGVIVELPFQIREREHATIRTTGKDGKEYQFPCLIQRVIRRKAKFLCGAEFILDVFSYAKIVKFVYGDSLHMLRNVLMPGGGLVAYGNSLQMLRNVLMPGGGLVAQGKAATKKIFMRMVKTVGMSLSLIFLNPKTRIREKK
jgi:hypothetical protein